ncbi:MULTISPECIES: phosphatase PAP2 family protein [Stenotrophomonas]|uniref:Phosphatase PAP2 family protein n=1 Tax=Stenotrophomonas lactitubi TaxID=2045214 RepID=A0AAW4GG13_9GAMM|nr:MULTISPECIES: phosphatase PAP2 family protein [Stenotrophomonas]MBM9913259.1 phosphatase PAP2 family protein [Stenotrophomonas lactitubi]MBM9923145.1 phosphatase PAP2 family protein [Stenotrophomonas lactitubi]MBM9939144.1 phosphatase PAP2 family protein [Stenotrophomonas lactitubi]
MMTFWESLSALGDSRALFPLATVLALFLPTSHRRLLWRWAAVVIVVAAITLASKIAFMGWGFGLEYLDFTGISGHAAMSSAVYPVTFWLLASGRSRRLRAWALAGTGLAVAIAVSRLPLQAHSLSEIVIGLSLGLAASAWVLHGSQMRGSVLAVRGRAALMAIAAATTIPALLADLHTHDLVKATARTMSGRGQAFERHDLRGHPTPAKHNR